MVVAKASTTEDTNKDSKDLPYDTLFRILIENYEKAPTDKPLLINEAGIKIVL